jgi:hypothetical protein
MKIMLDCVVTNRHPLKCSTNIQFLTFVKRTLQNHKDVFFYWMIPDWVSDEHFKETYPEDARIHYIRVPQHTDRTKEYLTLSKELDKCLGFNGDYWDFDVLVTMRTPMIPVMKMLMSSPRAANISWLKEVWLIEEMPLMQFKKTVMSFDPRAQDLQTISGYLAADRTYVMSYHEPGEIVNSAKKLFSPSTVRDLHQKLTPVVNVQLEEFYLKTPDQYPACTDESPFCIAHSGRMEMGNNIQEINDLMLKNYIMKDQKVRLLVTTVSSIIKVFNQEHIEVETPSREEFWRLAREEMHVIVNMVDDCGFLLSLVEPMMFGVPGIIIRRPWSEAIFGKDYPFFVSGQTQAYGMVQAFYDDYAKMYGIWTEWFNSKFKPMMQQRFESDLLYSKLDQDIQDFRQKRASYADGREGKKDNQFLKDVLEQVGDRPEFILKDIVAELHEAGKIGKVMLDKFAPDDRDYRHLAFSTYWNETRAILLELMEWKDASVKVGHFARAY